MQETDIITRCRNGELTGYRLLYQRYAAPLLHTGLRMLKDEQDAEDAVQITFIRVYRHLGTFRGESGFATWLFRIHMRVCFDMLKKRKRSGADPLTGEHGAPAPDYDLSLALQKGIELLPSQQKACFILYAVEGFKQREIAEILNIRTGTVKAHICHAKKRLRDLLIKEE